MALINTQNYYGIESKDIKHLEKNLIPIWERDTQIDEILLDVSKYLFIVENSPQLIPKYIFTKTAVDICSKIKITNNAISLIQPNEMINTGELLTNEWGHISLYREFYRYAVIKNVLFIVHVYLQKDPAKGKGEFISYSCYKMTIGTKDANYILDDYHKRFLQMLIFLKYTSPEIKEIESGKRVGTKRDGYCNMTQSNVKVVDSTWNKIVIRTDGFSVNGHLRLQPYGEGMMQRKLIWINPFEKHGYIRNNKSGITK